MNERTSTFSLRPETIIPRSEKSQDSTGPTPKHNRTAADGDIIIFNKTSATLICSQTFHSILNYF